MPSSPATFSPPERFNLADYFLTDRLREGRGERPAIRTDAATFTYRDVEAMANRCANLLRRAGIRPEERVMIALPDGPEFVAALFGTLKIGAVVVMVNPDARPEELAYFFEYTRARVALVPHDREKEFAAAAGGPPGAAAAGVAAAGAPGRHLLPDGIVCGHALARRLAGESADLAPFPTHRDDPAIWLFSGGTTGFPKAVVQTHLSFANTTECYAKRVIGYREADITISVPKLYFGYATGSNVFFPFAAGGSCVLFPERCTADVLFDKIARHRPTLLVNVPTMMNQMVSSPRAAGADLSSLRLATSAGEALPVELHERWNRVFGVEVLDGLGTAEMWHVFLTNFPGEARPGTLGRVVPGFEVEVRDDQGRPVPDGEVGWLWVRGNSRAIGYWQQMEKTREAFRGEWYVSGDMVSRDAAGVFTYGGRGDDMLKVSGKWVSPREVENCLLQHAEVREAAVIGAADATGLTKPHAFVVCERPVAEDGRAALAESLKTWVKERLAPHKYPREVHILEAMPTTHLGKIDRGALRAAAGGSAAAPAAAGKEHRS